jgi:hypothetical protein
MMMTDAALGRALAPDANPGVQLRLVQALGDRRGVYERLIEVSDEIGLWEAGVGPKPIGVIVCHARRGSQ